MLDPALLGCHVIKLPTKLREGQERLAGYALEDQLIEDPDQYHFALGAESAAGTRILAMARTHLAALLAAFDSVGRPLDRLVAATELLPPTQEDWLLWQSPAQTVVLQMGLRGNCPVDTIADIGRLIAGATEPPARLQIIGAPELSIEVRKAELPVAVVDGGAFDWASGEWRGAINLLVGSFRPRRSLGRWRKALLLTGVALGLYTVVAVGEWAGMAWRLATLKQSIENTARAALPGQPMVAPLPQLVAAADLQQHRRGESGLGDFIPLALRAAELAGSARVQEINYETGRLTMQVDSLDADREKAARDALAMSGLELRVARQAGAVRVAIAVDANGELR
jgi:type II secretion system protein L